MTELMGAIPRDQRLAAVLSSLVPGAVERVRWPRGIDLEVTNYFTAELPPLELVTRVRAVLVRRGQVLVFDAPDGWSHVVPGGGIEPGETPLEALTREVREEVACELDGPPRLLGISLFHNLRARDPELPAHYPYPDFLQLIYAAATSCDPVSDGTDPLVLRPRFVDPAEVMQMRVPPTQLEFVELALRAVS